MRKLIIDGNSVFEIDEECLKRRNIPKNCDVEKYFERELGFSGNNGLEAGYGNFNKRKGDKEK